MMKEEEDEKERGQSCDEEARWSNQILLVKQVHTEPPYVVLACAGSNYTP